MTEIWILYDMDESKSISGWILYDNGYYMDING